MHEAFKLERHQNQAACSFFSRSVCKRPKYDGFLTYEYEAYVYAVACRSPRRDSLVLCSCWRSGLCRCTYSTVLPPLDVSACCHWPCRVWSLLALTVGLMSADKDVLHASRSELVTAELVACHSRTSVSSRALPGLVHGQLPSLAAPVLAALHSFCSLERLRGTRTSIHE